MTIRTIGKRVIFADDDIKNTLWDAQLMSKNNIEPRLILEYLTKRLGRLQHPGKYYTIIWERDKKLPRHLERNLLEEVRLPDKTKSRDSDDEDTFWWS